MNHIAQVLTYILPVVFALVAIYAHRPGRHGKLLAGFIGFAAMLSFLQVGFTMEFAWSRDFVNALWITVAASVFIFAILAFLDDAALELSGLFIPMVSATAFFAMAWQLVRASDLPDNGAVVPDSPWIVIHIVSAVITYALLTIAACASLAVWIKESALKARSRNRLADSLPPVFAAENLQLKLLIFAELVLALSLLSGMAVEYASVGSLLRFSHKETLSLVAFVMIGVLLLAHYRFGVRGRRASRVLLSAYLLVVMGYPGVKFVLDVLVS